METPVSHDLKKCLHLYMSIDCMKQGILIYHKYRKFSLNLIFDLNKPLINHLPLIVYNFDYTITTITD